MIALNDLVVRYPGSPTNAVDGVSFVGARGKLTALAGPNGSGKSSIVRALLRRIDTVSGTMTLDDRDVRAFSYSELAKNMAVVPQREETAFPMARRRWSKR